MTAILLFFVFASASLGTYATMAGSGNGVMGRRLAAVRRRGGHVMAADLADELQAPLTQRLMAPVVHWFYQQIRRLTPASALEQTRLQLAQAGVQVDPVHWLGVQALASVGGALAALTLASPLLVARPVGAMFAVAVVLVLGWRLPPFWLARQTTLRRKAVERTLPDVLDLLSVSVEAGLGFDGAAQKVSEKFPEPVSGEFREYLKAIRLGATRADALRSLAARVDLADMRTFCAALIQADQLGVPIGKVLRTQSEAMRTRRKQRVEEKAMQLPLKMLFPLLLFIFPTIFIVVLGPVVIQFLTVFITR